MLNGVMIWMLDAPGATDFGNAPCARMMWTQAVRMSCLRS
jgi:hypothetical protein